MSEDWLFCNRWRALGGRIFISKRFALTHVGTYAFSEASQAALLKHLSAQLSASPAKTATTSPLSTPTASTSTSAASEERKKASSNTPKKPALKNNKPKTTAAKPAKTKPSPKPRARPASKNTRTSQQKP